MTPLDRLRLEKAAADCGFERTPVLLIDGGMELRSAQFPESVLVHAEEGGYRISASTAVLLDDAYSSSIFVTDLDQLYFTLQRASAIARTMPNRVANQFRREKLLTLAWCAYHHYLMSKLSYLSRTNCSIKIGLIEF
ncbi:hypothetical protein [Eoetvoesiella caeni]